MCDGDWFHQLLVENSAGLIPHCFRRGDELGELVEEANDAAQLGLRLQSGRREAADDAV